jgi:hypothetical protein
MEVRPGGGFMAWVTGLDDVWAAIRERQPVVVIGDSAGAMYIGRGVPDQVSGAGVRIVGVAHKAGWIERPLLRLATKALERERASVLD